MRPTDPRLRARLAPARTPLAGVLASGVLGAVLVVAQAWLVTGLVVAVVRGDDVAGWGLGVVAVLLGRAASGALGDLLAARAATRVATDLRARLLARLVDGVVVHPVLLTRGVAAAEPYLTRYLPALVLAVLLPPLVVVAMATQDLLSAAIVVATLPLVPVFGALVGLATRDRAEQQWRAMSSLSGHFLDVVRGLPTLVAHRRAVVQSRRIAEVTDRYRVATLRTLRIAFASSAVLELVATLSVALVAVTVGVRLAQGGLDLRTALVVLLLAPEAYWPLRRVGAEFHAAAEGVATFEQAHALLEGEVAREVVPPATGDLVLDRVSVTYPGRTAPALAPLSAVLPSRGVTVVSGPSGCGKSTLLRVVAGLVEHDGVLSSRPPRSQVAWLPQQPRFVRGSVADNLRLARPDATDDALWAALRQVALAERVAAMPRGLASPLGEDGLSLSAGERARLALARVVLADRPWSLLDEPTAHLDALTEQVICDVVQQLGRRGAVLVVAHRPALLAVADHTLPLLPADRAPVYADPVRVHVDPAHVRAAEPGRRTDETGRRGGLGVATVLGALASASGVALTATAGWLIVQASTQPAVLTLLVAVVGVRAFGLARPVLRYAERLRSHDAALRLLARRRVQVYDALVPLVPGRVGRRGDVLAAVVDDVDSVVDRELRVRMPVRQALAVVLLAGAVAAWLLPVAGVAVLALGLAAVAAYGAARWGGARAERETVATRARLSEQVVEATQLAEDLRMWQAVDAVVARASVTSDAAGRAAEHAMRWLVVARAAVLAAVGLGVAAAAWLVGPTVGQTVSAPMAALLVLLPLALADVLLPVADAGALSARTAAAAARLVDLETATPAVDDTGRHRAGDGPTTSVHDARLRGLALSLTLPPGERLAVVGASGSGKSTLASLLLRFLDPDSGEVRRGSRSLRDLTLDDVRRTTGLVDDAPHVFATTLVENVRLARPAASDADVAQALRRARLGAWLDALPEGLHTWLGEGHAEVSGGERARLGVARSLLADQPVLVLDEPTAHLDHATAVELAREVLTGPRERSVLWITHDPVGLGHADRVQDLGPAGAGSSDAAVDDAARRG